MPSRNLKFASPSWVHHLVTSIEIKAVRTLSPFLKPPTARKSRISPPRRYTISPISASGRLGWPNFWFPVVFVLYVQGASILQLVSNGPTLAGMSPLVHRQSPVTGHQQNRILPSLCRASLTLLFVVPGISYMKVYAYQILVLSTVWPTEVYIFFTAYSIEYPISGRQIFRVAQTGQFWG